MLEPAPLDRHKNKLDVAGLKAECHAAKKFSNKAAVETRRGGIFYSLREVRIIDRIVVVVSEVFAIELTRNTIRRSATKTAYGAFD